MKIKALKQDFSVCRLNDIHDIDVTQEFCFLGKTDEEISLVCEREYVPEEVISREDGWCAFRVEGVLDFSLTGILAKIATLLGDHEISIFALSTYNTDYILTKKEQFKKALHVLSENGYEIEE